MEGLLIIILLCLLSIFFMKTYKKQKGGEPGFSLVKIMIIVSVLGLIIYSGNNLLNKPKNNQGGGGPTGDTLPVDSSTGDTLPVEEDKSCPPDGNTVAQNERYCPVMPGMCKGPSGGPVYMRMKYVGGIYRSEECQAECDSARPHCTGYSYFTVAPGHGGSCGVHGGPELDSILKDDDGWSSPVNPNPDILPDTTISSGGGVIPNYSSRTDLGRCVAVAGAQSATAT